ncbi:carbohydrate ABC transporter permease [Paenibacillus sp.]|uniref:carbohydrate ABC transporter permease n=1 Tax=Paenibacillus sp. TaxID=58172 RepID=UPI0028115A9B|nr:carbohydrate ABC transporter permease [Paenibacillus sp.]
MRSIASKTVLHTVLLLCAAFMFLPFFWMITTSVKTYADSVQIPPVWFPTQFDFGWYVEVFERVQFGTYLKNTVIMTLGRVLPQVLVCAMAGYGFARLKFPGRDVLFVIVLALLMVPGQVVLIPQYFEVVKLGWIDTFAGLIVPQIFSAYGVFLLRQFFLTLPAELEEAAKIDGAHYGTIFFRVLLPLTTPAIATMAFFGILWSWNDFLWPLVVVNSESMKVLSVGMSALQGNTRGGLEYPLIMAGAVLCTVPLIVFFVALQNYIVKGIAFSGIKG